MHRKIRKMPLKKLRKFMRTAFVKWKKRRNSDDELSAQKAAMVNSLKKLTEDTARLMEKMQG